MGLLRRLFGGGASDANADRDASAGDPEGALIEPTAAEVDAEEQARELELLREEQGRLDELVLRQQRYADRSWVPPAQGGPRRSDDEESNAGDKR
jgi:hypothetical protein